MSYKPRKSVLEHPVVTISQKKEKKRKKRQNKDTKQRMKGGLKPIREELL
jgi:hypothetical protein